MIPWEPSITVLTAVVGSRTDPLRAPAYVSPSPTVSYVCYTGEPADTIPAPWQVRPLPDRLPPPYTDDVTLARQIKLLAHDYVNADIIVWQDAAYCLHVDPALFVPLLARKNVLALQHPYRQTIEQEAAELIKLGLTGPQVHKQVAKYRAAGFPAETPLTSSGLLIRRSDRATRRFSQYWYQQLRHWEHPRDQLSLDFAAWRCGVPITHLEGHYRKNPYAEWTYTRTRGVR